MSNLIEAFVVKGDNEARDVNPLTGAQRDSQEGKVRFDLIGTHLLKRLGAHVTKGAKKYKERNWEKGQNVSRTWASLWRHVVAYQEGERTEDHLAAIAFNVMSIMHVEEEVLAGRLPADLLDIEFYKELDQFAAAFGVPTWQEKVVLDELETYIDGYQAVYVPFSELKEQTFPSIDDNEFGNLLASLTNKGYLTPRVVMNRVRPDYALTQQVELHGEPPEDEYIDEHDYDYEDEE